jgi:hypothetical protein
VASGRPVPRSLAAALALAEYYFPQVDEQGRTVVRVKDAHFLLTGQLHRWDRWESLSYPEAQRLGRLLAHRSDDLAGLARFERRVRQLCTPNPETGAAVSPTHVTADADHPDVVTPSMGGIRWSWLTNCWRSLRGRGRSGWRRPGPGNAGPGSALKSSTFLLTRLPSKLAVVPSGPLR